MLRALLSLLLGLSLGFILGRVSGLKEGEKRGSAFAPLQLKAEGLQQQRCPVCGQALPQRGVGPE